MPKHCRSSVIKLSNNVSYTKITTTKFTNKDFNHCELTINVYQPSSTIKKTPHEFVNFVENFFKSCQDPSPINRSSTNYPKPHAIGEHHSTTTAMQSQVSNSNNLQTDDVIPRELEEFVDNFLNNWKDQFPNNKFWNDLLEFLMPHYELDKRQISAATEDFSRAFGQTYLFQLHPFGSTLTGLAFRDSDFNIIVECNVPFEVAIRFIRNLAKRMRRQGQWENVSIIPSARGDPSIRAIHCVTGRRCDFSFPDYMYSMYNTQLIIHLLSVDQRIKPLTMLLKYWFRVNGLLGGSGSGKFTSYGLFMMIVFYLQVIPNPLLPPIIQLQQKVPPVDLNGWNAALDVNNNFRTTNTSSEIFLLYGFFMYYNTFDFENNLVCPLMGRTFDRKTLHSDPPVELWLYFRYLEREPAHGLLQTDGLCVQDPHRLNTNVANCSLSIFQKFKQYLQTVCQHIAQTVSVNNTEKVGLLAELLTKRVADRTPAVRREPPNRKPMVIVPFYAELTAVADQLGGEPDRNTISQCWQDLVVMVLDRMLRDLAVLRVDVVTPDALDTNSTIIRRFSASLNPNKRITKNPRLWSTKNATPALANKLMHLKDVLLNETQVGLQFDITLSAKGNAIVLNVDSPRWENTSMSDADAKRQFEIMRAFFLTHNQGIRGTIANFFKHLESMN